MSMVILQSDLVSLKTRISTVVLAGAATAYDGESMQPDATAERNSTKTIYGLELACTLYSRRCTMRVCISLLLPA